MRERLGLSSDGGGLLAKLAGEQGEEAAVSCLGKKKKRFWLIPIAIHFDLIPFLIKFALM